MSAARQFRLLTIHYALYQFATAMAGGFVGAYLLREGLSLSQALCAYAALLVTRFGLRFLALGAVRRLGPRLAIALGAGLNALQFAPLMRADRPSGLAVWILTVSLAEALYWPTYHAAMAVTGGDASRGRELGLRTAVGTLVGFLGPLLGGALLAMVGPAADFALAAGLCLASALPALSLESFDVGPTPDLRSSFGSIDRLGISAFAADGWLCSGIAIAWPMILFVSLGSHYQSLGLANAVGCLAGAATGLACGGAIDRGRRGRWLAFTSWALLASVALRAGAAWSPIAAQAANLTGAAVMGLYTPVLMSAIYDRAKRSGAAFRFHFAAEAGWDAGASLGCLAAAAVASWTPVSSLAMLPCALAIGALRIIVGARGSAAGWPAGQSDLAHRLSHSPDSRG